MAQLLMGAWKSTLVTNALLIDGMASQTNDRPTASDLRKDTSAYDIEQLGKVVNMTINGPTTIGNVAHNCTDFSQTATVGIQLQDLPLVVEFFSSHLDDLKLEPRDKQRAAAQLNILETELAGKPDRAIIKLAGRGLLNITQNAIGSLLATAACDPLWHLVKATLASISG